MSQPNHPRFAGAARARSYNERIAEPPRIEHDESETVDPPVSLVEDLPEEEEEESVDQGESEVTEAAKGDIPPRPLARPELLPSRTRRPKPAKWGFRGTLSRAGIRMSPGAMEAQHREHEEFIRQMTWPRPVYITSTAEKGGSGKTPAAVVVAGLFAQLKGGLTLAWEARESAGTLSDRTEGRSTRGLNQLLRDAEQVRTPGVLSSYVTDQTSYAQILGSTGQRVMTAEDVPRLTKVFDHTHRIIVTDTGNDPQSELFSNVMAKTDALVVPVPVRADHANPVLAFLHEAKKNPETADLVRRATVVITNDGKRQTPGLAARLLNSLEELGVESIMHVPYDPALDNDGPIVLEDLSRESRVAWTKVTAAIAASINVK